MKFAWSVGLLLLVAPATGQTAVSFSTPSFFDDVRVDHADLLAHAGNHEAASQIVLVGGPGRWQRVAAVMADEDTGDVDIGAATLQDMQVEESQFRSIRLEAQSAGLHGIALNAESVGFHADMMKILTVVGAGDTVTTYEQYGGSFVDRYPVPANDSLVLRSSSLTAITASNSMLVSLAGWQGTVSLDGEDFALERDVVPRSASLPATAYYVYHIEVDGELELVSKGGNTDTLVVASNANASAEGRVLLPKVQDDPGVGQHLPNGSLLIAGPVELNGLSVKDLEQRRIGSQVSGDFVIVRVDGQLVDSVVMSTAVSLGAIGALLIGARVIGVGLFTRLSPTAALEHPRRQSLHRYIQENPGATFRELCRATDIPAGTCRHHLSVLDRAQVIVEHRHRSTVRFFENHGKFDSNWEDIVMLREPELAKVHEWLAEHEGVIQKDILEHAQSAWGWSRSTTQHRLQRLVDNGVLEVQEMGRRKSYVLAEANPEPVRQFGLRV